MKNNLFGLSDSELQERGELTTNMGGAGMAIALLTGDVYMLVVGTLLGLVGITAAIIGQHRSMYRQAR